MKHNLAMMCKNHADGGVEEAMEGGSAVNVTVAKVGTIFEKAPANVVVLAIGHREVERSSSIKKVSISRVQEKILFAKSDEPAFLIFGVNIYPLGKKKCYHLKTVCRCSYLL